MTIWKLKKGQDRRIRAGHPWVYAAEVATSPRGLTAGAPVELQDDMGRFIARGYGHPQSMIAFRAVSFDSSERDPLSPNSLREKVLEAWQSRRSLGFRGSFRLVFSEGDMLPGLIVDLYRLADKPTQVFAVQVLTSGMQKALGPAEVFFRDLTSVAMERGLTELDWDHSAVVLRNDVRIRELEGLEEEPARFVKSVRDVDFTAAKILLNEAVGPGTIEMTCDLFLGQKTGFFLDQTANIELVCRMLDRDPTWKSRKRLRVLDLCCYVGHWSAQLSHWGKTRGLEVECTLVDVSKNALERARLNVERQGGRAVVVEADVLKSLSTLEGEFDVVIADPPAFVKSKKDLPTGRHAYLKFNTQAFRLAAPGALVASCSCSGLFEEGELREVVAKAIRRNFREARLVARGGPAPDHPGRLGFAEGMYLKMLVNQTGFAARTVVPGAGSIVVDED